MYCCWSIHFFLTRWGKGHFEPDLPTDVEVFDKAQDSTINFQQEGPFNIIFDHVRAADFSGPLVTFDLYFCAQD